MALPLATTGSLCPTFVPARLVGLAVKHPIYHYARRMIADHAEGTFELLPEPKDFDFSYGADGVF